MINIFLHIINILVVLYYAFINNTDYDKPLYLSINELHTYFYKKTSHTRNLIKDYERKSHREEDRKEHINKKKENCEKCNDLHTSRDRRICKDRNNCAHFNNIETFANTIETFDNKKKDLDVINNESIFIELKIIFMMIMCVIYASQQHYGRSGGFTLSNVFNAFTGGIENVIYLSAIVMFLVFIYLEMDKLYD